MVMPLYDDNPFTQPIKPVVTWCLIALNLGIFLYEAGATQLALERTIDVFSLTPAALVGDMSARGWVPAFVTLVTVASSAPRSQMAQMLFELKKNAADASGYFVATKSGLATQSSPTNLEKLV